MKKFWIIFVSLLLCAVIGVGIWHGIAYGDNIKVFAEETWQKIESVFKKDDVNSDDISPDDSNVELCSHLVERREVICEAVSCVESGQVGIYCQDCGVLLRTEKIEGLHNYIMRETNATQSCPMVSSEINGEVVYIGAGVECSECSSSEICCHKHLATREYVCSYCGDTYVTEGDYLHNFWTLSNSATCEERGVKVEECLGCGYVYEHESAALGHSFANCQCARCGVAPREVLINADYDDVTGYEFDIAFNTWVYVYADDGSWNVEYMHFEKLLVGSCTKLGSGLSFVDVDGNEVLPNFTSLDMSFYCRLCFDDCPTGEIVDWLSANARMYIDATLITR